MKTLYLGLLTSICSLLLFSCSEDKGNYTYQDINEVKVSGLTDLVKYTKLDRLIVEPTIEFTLNSKGEYQYTWIARLVNVSVIDTTGRDIVLGKEKKLDYLVDLKEGTYTITLKITDLANQLVWNNSFKLTVASATYEGWMVLCNDNGYARLDMIEESGETPLHSKDLLSYTPLTPKRGPLKMATFTIDLSGYEIFMLTDDGCTKLVASNLTWEESNDFRYTLGNTSLSNMQVTDISGASVTGTLLVGDGNAYWRKQQGGALFGLPVNIVDGSAVKVAPFIGKQNGSSTLFGTNNFVLFDEEHDCFLRYNRNDSKCTVLDNFPKGYKLKTIVNSTFRGGTSYAILYKTDPKEYYLFSFQANSLQAGIIIPMEIPNVENISYFAFDPLESYMYYAYNNGNQLHLYSWTEEKPENKITPLQKFENEEITMLKFNSTINGLFGDTYPDQILLIGTATKDNKGTLRLLTPQSNRAQPKVYATYDDFAPIVDATYRER